MRKTSTFPVVTLSALTLSFSLCGLASAGWFRGPIDYSVGPYRGGEPLSYFEAYNYYGVANVSTYPYWAAGVYPYFWESPYTWGSGSRYPSLFSRYYRPGYYNATNPAYLTPRAYGYSKEAANDVKLPPMNKVSGLAAVIDVKMPCYGDLWVDDVPTEQLGTDRLFRSPPLAKGAEYLYVLRARWLDGGGKPVEQTREVRVHSGDRLLVVFPQGTESSKP
jgi:uncharacterized protein (TIGR03000 family)